jgi:hypothetical protein
MSDSSPQSPIGKGNPTSVISPLGDKRGSPVASPSPHKPTSSRQQGGAAPPQFTLAGGSRILPDGTLNAPDVLLAILLIVAVAQAHLVPSDIHRFIDTILGRILLFVIVIAITAWKGWVIGLLTAMVALRLLMHTGRSEADVQERFSGRVQEYFTNKAAAEGFTEQNIKMVTKNKNEEEKHRWFVEEVLEEEPDWIDTDKVKTEAIKGGN